jgi:hypothetical protein
MNSTTAYFFSSVTNFCSLWALADSVLFTDWADCDDGALPFAEGASVFSLAAESPSTFVFAAI